MTETTGVIEEGQPVCVQQDTACDPDAALPPLEDEEWTEEDIQHELEWATGKQLPF